MKRNHTLAEMNRFRSLSLEYAKGNMPLGKLKRKKHKLSHGLVLSRRQAHYVEYIQSDRWGAFRERIIAERGRRCERCGAEDGVRHVHHKTYQRFGREIPADVEILCVLCHDKEHPNAAARWAKKRKAVDE